MNKFFTHPHLAYSAGNNILSAFVAYQKRTKFIAIFIQFQTIILWWTFNTHIFHQLKQHLNALGGAELFVKVNPQLHAKKNALIKLDIHWTQFIHSFHLQTNSQWHVHTAAYFNYQRQKYSMLFTIKCFRVKMKTHLHNMLDKRKFYVEIYIYLFWSDWQKFMPLFSFCWCWITNPHFEFCDLLMAGKFRIDLNRLIVCYCHLLKRAPATITQLMNILSF